MTPLPHTFTTRLRVRYAETDQMGVVYHANYLVWFEVGRVEMMRELGFSYRQLEAEGCALPVVEVNCRYRQPARYDDELELETRLVAMRGSIIKFAYQLSRPESAGIAGISGIEDNGKAADKNSKSEDREAKGEDQESWDGADLGDGRSGRQSQQRLRGMLLAEAVTTHVVVDRTLRPRALPESYVAVLRSVVAQDR